MSLAAQLDELHRLVRLLADGGPVALGAIPWASPVMMFGSLLKSRVATLGLNPSNLEFEAAGGNPLRTPLNRFETLSTLRLKSWKRAKKDDLDRIWDACECYFDRRPYDGWFKPLDKVISGLDVSYYDNTSSACHLDLVPFATATKWSGLDARSRTQLMAIGMPTLVQLIRVSDVRVLVLNGASVVRAFEYLIGKPLNKSEMPGWSLRRGDEYSVKGYSYLSHISSISGLKLGRNLLVLGYNHNIQSSFGVSAAVVQEIRKWVAHSAKGVLRESS